MKSQKGKLIVIDGSDGSGKATQRDLLAKTLREKNVKVETIEFPRYDANIYGKLVGRYLKGEFGNIFDVSPYFTSLPYAIDRLFAKPSIEKWLREGKLVLADRYVSASLAHQSAKLQREKRRKFLNWLEELEYGANGMPREDLVIFLFVQPSIAQKNVFKKSQGDIHESDLSYLSESTKMFLQLSKRKNWVKIDCMRGAKMRSIEDIHLEIMDILRQEKII